MNATTVTVQPFGSEQPFTISIADLYTQFEQVQDQRKRRGVRYPLGVLLTIALIAKLSGYSQLRAIAEWARERAAELAALFHLERSTMPHPTSYSFGASSHSSACTTSYSRGCTSRLACHCT
jgi:hypothetical protein